MTTQMMKPVFETKLAKLYQFFGLTMPDTVDFVDNCYKILRRFSAGALEHAFDLFRENHATIKRGENVAFALRQYAETWRDPETDGSRTRHASNHACPFSCDSGMFYIVSQSELGTSLSILPCANCNPHTRSAVTPQQIAARGLRRLTVQEAIDFRPFQTGKAPDPRLNPARNEKWQKALQLCDF